ncbi:hypothetical protein [Microbispora sp. H10949]|uniref:hypothetical protein n=1 Tax=Microbispora sp. H10949 TaxID=2729111 RepID=UPI0016044268|nr:hypothetical protein [Microbispora sp. H10949]
MPYFRDSRPPRLAFYRLCRDDTRVFFAGLVVTTAVAAGLGLGLADLRNNRAQPLASSSTPTSSIGSAARPELVAAPEPEDEVPAHPSSWPWPVNRSVWPSPSPSPTPAPSMRRSRPVRPVVEQPRLARPRPAARPAPADDGSPAPARPRPAARRTPRQNAETAESVRRPEPPQTPPSFSGTSISEAAHARCDQMFPAARDALRNRMCHDVLKSRGY